MYKSIIVGCGNIAGGESLLTLNTHAGAITHNKKIELTACVDIDSKKAYQFSKKFNCDHYTDLTLALRKNKPELVNICTPDKAHFSVIEYILKVRNPPKVIFTEKPICLTLSEYYKLRSLSRKRNVLIVINHTRRFNKKYQQIKHIIKTNYIGTLKRVNAYYYGGWLHNGIHLIDTLTFLLEEKIKWSRISNLKESRYFNDSLFDLEGETLIKKTKLYISYIDEILFQLFEFDFWFTDGRLRIEDFGNKIILEKALFNEQKERVLIPNKINIECESYTEMQIAIHKICDYLTTSLIKPLADVTIEAGEESMKALITAKDLTMNKSN